MKLPSNLDFRLLINVSLILYNTQHALGITNSINFWYNSFDIIPNIEKKDYTMLVITNFFFVLFLHWSKNVREIFYHFICYRLMFWLETTNDTSIETIACMINEKINLIEISSKIYQQEIFKWEQAIHHKEKHTSYHKLLKNIKVMIKNTVIPPDEIKNMLNNHKLDVLIREKRRNISNISDITRNDGYIIELKDENVKMKKKRNYKHSKEGKSIITERQLAYCKRSLSEFQEIIGKYKQDVVKLKLDNTKNIPRLTFKLPIDNFEILDDDENKW